MNDTKNLEFVYDVSDVFTKGVVRYKYVSYITGGGTKWFEVENGAGHRIMIPAGTSVTSLQQAMAVFKAAKKKLVREAIKKINNKKFCVIEG
ncbi:MAG: hypothetical protein GWN00_01025 [Aliifodinibius sp.]|nr:hypothetical protein [Fodinibius sp.]NIV09913.1 hypothetical protein [Fodinibius sp.]NIY23443.1 hypothetical protein [Fodinibius sp.]